MSRWDTLEDLFARALPLDAAAREELLAGIDAELRTELEAMLSAERPLAIERLATDDRPDPAVGTVIGRWRVVGRLGRGGMASVYRAERADGEYQQQAALKLVPPGVWGPDMVERFRTERQVLARLTHPHIARLLDGGLTDDGRPYLVMELVDGAPITEWCETRKLPIAARLRLFRVVCEAVQHAHGMLVVHRDLKPANTFVTVAGEVKLLDFGIAKLLDPAAFGVEASATREGPAPLTPEYAAPEQLFGGAITTATDVYSLGVLLYELLTGSRPFSIEGKTPVEVERQMMSGAIEPPSRRLGRRRGDDLDSIVLTALRARPERRYISAGQLGEDIGRYLDGRPVVARPDTLRYRARRFVGRNRAGVAAAVTLALSLAAFGIVATWEARRAATERDAAQVERDKSEKIVGLLVELFETSNPNVHPDGDKMSIRQFLANAEPGVLGRLADQPAVRARMRQVFGSIHVARDENDAARASFEQALAEQRLLLGPDHPEAIESLYQLGVIRRNAGDNDGADVVLHEVLDRCVRVFGENHEKTARTLMALTREDKLDEAGPLIERALAIRRRVLPPNHPDLADSLGGLALYYKLKGDKPRARALYAEALAVFRTPEDRRNATAIILLNDYATLLGELDDTDASIAMYRESIELAKAVYGPDTLPVAHNMHNLAIQLMQHGRLADGEATFRATYERHRAILGETHWKTVNIGRDMAWTLMLEQRYDEALSWIDRSIAAILRAPGDNTAMLYDMQGRRGVILLRLGRGAEALALLESTLASATAATPPLPKYVAGYLRSQLVVALLEAGRAAEAEPMARTVLGELEGAPTITVSKCVLGWALVRNGHRAEGRALLVESLPAYRSWGLADPKLVESLDRALADSR